MRRWSRACFSRGCRTAGVGCIGAVLEAIGPSREPQILQNPSLQGLAAGFCCRRGDFTCGRLQPIACSLSDGGADDAVSRDVESWWLRTLPRYGTFENGRQMQPDDIWVSIVVDTVDDHLYKADPDLLIRTLDIALLCRSATLTAYLFTFQSAQGPLSRSHLGLQMNTLKSASGRLPHNPILRACLEAACSTSPSKK